MAGADRQTPLEFPCEFPIKAMGEARPGFEALVIEIVREHAPDLAETAVHSTASRHGTYTAVTVTITARSRAQLDAIYRDLTARAEVIMAL
ncbi:MAG: DUF493 domain-containing protein [Gammaproteobacteria bacterium]|nr:DUF493 domain-containing protein [Gammaproteobacteria bacterium]